MTTAALLADLDRLGVTLDVDGDRLRFHPRDRIGPELLTRLRDHKRDLIDALRALREPHGAEGVQPDPEAGPGPASRYRVDPRPLTVDAKGWPLDLTDRDGRPLTLVDPPVADCACGRMVCPWCDLGGRWRCLACDPPALPIPGGPAR